jgi:hypothetical protein
VGGRKDKKDVKDTAAAASQQSFASFGSFSSFAPFENQGVTKMRCPGRSEIWFAFALSLLLLAASAPSEEKKIPIIPGANGFGIETPAGSGRHLLNRHLPEDLDASLVGHWDFDGGKAVDKARNGKEGRLVGQTAVVARGNGRALRLDGTEGYLDLSDPDGYMKPTSGLTVMAWAYLDARGGAIVANRGEQGGFWQLRHVAGFGGKWQLAVRNGAGTKHHAEWHDYTTEGIWRHVAGVYDAETGRIRFYLNGKQLHSGWNKTTEDLAAVRSCNLAVGSGVKGMIDDVMLFDRSLPEEDIAAVYAVQAGYYFPTRTEIYHVTNLNDAGPGSLRKGIESQERSRTIIFEVSGTIALERGITLSGRNCYLTIAGATAPSPGISIKNHGFSVGNIGGEVHDVLIQHLRFRTGDEGIPPEPTKSQMPDALVINSGTRRIVVDHCSFAWGTDMNVMTGADDATFSNLITAEALATPLHPKGPHSKGFYVLSYRGGERGGHRTAVLRNLIAFNHDRNPAVSAGTVVIANNYIHGCTSACTIQIDDHAGRRKGFVKTAIAANVIEKAGPIAFRSGPNPESKFYVASDNIRNGETIAAPWKSKHVTTQHPWPKRAPIPQHKIVARPGEAIWIPDYEPMPAERVKDVVLANAGARPADRDPVDERIITNILAGKGKVIASQKDVGGWPHLAENRRELTPPANRDADDNDNGYTNLEDWLHGFAAEVEGNKQ